MICPSCGFLNKSEEKICQRCKNTLTERLPYPPQVPLFLSKLEKLCRDISLGQISLDDFKEELKKNKENLIKIKKDLEKTNIPADILPQIKEEMTLGLKGIEFFITGMEKMEEYIKKRNLKFLEEGLKLSREGNALLDSAIKANWMQFRAFQESIEDFLRQQEI